MGNGSWGAFAKSVLVPMLIALSIYVVVFLIVLPLYRRYRTQLARYSNYTPLSSSLTQQTTSIFEPYLIDPSRTLVQKLKDSMMRAVRRVMLPSAWAWEVRASRQGERSYDITSTEQGHDEFDEESSGLFDEESGEAMVGFDFQREDSRVDRGRTRERGDRRREHIDTDDSNRRLSRELEEGFRDDSGSEVSDEEVTAGRRTVSRRPSEA